MRAMIEREAGAAGADAGGSAAGVAWEAAGFFLLNHDIINLPRAQPFSPICMISATALEITALEI